jgi:hypothetical protein
MRKIGLQGTMSTQGITVVSKYLPKTTLQFSDTTQDSALLLQDQMVRCSKGTLPGRYGAANRSGRAQYQQDGMESAHPYYKDGPSFDF